jgi:hypothetical protein
MITRMPPITPPTMAPTGVLLDFGAGEIADPSAELELEGVIDPAAEFEVVVAGPSDKFTEFTDAVGDEGGIKSDDGT